MDAQSLKAENAEQADVHRGAVLADARANRQHGRSNARLDLEVFQRDLQRHRQRRSGRGGGKGHHQRVKRSAEKAAHRQPRHQLDKRQVHQHNLRDHADDDAKRQLADIGEHRHAVFGHCARDQRQHTDGRQFHDQGNQVEQHAPCRLQQIGDRLALLARQDDAEPERHRKEDDRQHVALDQRLHDVDRNNAHQLVMDRLWLTQRMALRHTDCRAAPRLDEQSDDHADADRTGRGCGEQRNGMPANHAQLARIGQGSHARCDADKDDRHHQHPDQPHEQFTQKGDPRCGIGPEQADQDTARQPRQDPLPQRDVQPASKQQFHQGSNA